MEEFKGTKEGMSTNEMLLEIVSYKYESFGFPHVFLSYSHTFKNWSIAWRNPVKFSNSDKTDGETPKQACKNALKFIKENPKLFTTNPTNEQ